MTTQQKETSPWASYWEVQARPKKESNTRQVQGSVRLMLTSEDHSHELFSKELDITIIDNYCYRGYLPRLLRTFTIRNIETDVNFDILNHDDDVELHICADGDERWFDGAVIFGKHVPDSLSIRARYGAVVK